MLKAGIGSAILANNYMPPRISITFKLSQGGNTGGYLNYTVTFNSVGSVSHAVMMEELIHALQQSLYGLAAMNNARANVEFEAKMIRELLARDGLVRMGGTCYGSELSEFYILGINYNGTEFSI